MRDGCPDGGRSVVVVSADSHVGPLPQQLRPYCPERLREVFDSEVVFHRRRLAVLSHRQRSRQTAVANDDVMRSTTPTTLGHHDSAARLADMDRDGISASVLFDGSQNGHGLPFVDREASRRGRLADPDRRELEAEGRRIYNRWLADFCAEAPARHIGVCKVPIWDLEESAREVAWAAEHGLRGVHFPATLAGLPSFEDPVWEPFFATCAEREMVLVTHISGSEQLFPSYDGPGGVAIRALESSWLGRRPMWLLTFTGAFDRHPGLKFAMTELPGAWWAETVREMDAAYFSYHGRRSLQGFLKRKPSEYVGTNVWVGASFQSRDEALSALDAGAVDRMMWGSDYPHVEGTWLYSDDPNEPSVTRLSLANTFHGLDEAVIRKMTGANAISCYGLDETALRSVAEVIGPDIDELSSPPDLRAVPERYQGYGFRRLGAWS